MDDVFFHFLRDYVWIPFLAVLGWLVTRSIAHRNDLDAHKLYVSESYVKQSEHKEALSRLQGLQDQIYEGFQNIDEKLDRKFDVVFNKIDGKQDKRK